MSSFDLKALIRKKIQEPGYEKLRETLGETLGLESHAESHQESHEIQPQNERIRHTTSLKSAKFEIWPKDCFKNVPDDTAVLFPSIRHNPDLKGFGVASETLPDDLQIFGYWGYRLEHIPHTRTLQLVTTVRSDPCRHHVLCWLKWRHDEVLEAFNQWHRRLLSYGTK